MNTSKHSFFIESTDPRQEGRALALEVICCLLLWMADEPSTKTAVCVPSLVTAFDWT